VYWKSNAYFAQDSYTSIYVMTGGRLLKSTYVSEMYSNYYAPRGNRISTVTLAALREAIDKQKKGINSSTPTSVALPTTTT
jgi:hypothetical protein